jgi:cellulose synthase/poly-beta-1,6-N-acetylglucosamine synthase-like glycosyltransferase
MTLVILSLFALICAAIPALMFISNLKFFQPPPPLQSFAINERDRPEVSLLIPARNEEAGIEDAVHAALQSQAIEIEIVVLDDHSTDTTADIVQRIANSDPRVRLIRASHSQRTGMGSSMRASN